MLYQALRSPMSHEPPLRGLLLRRLSLALLYLAPLCVVMSACLEAGDGPAVSEGFTPRVSYPEGPYGVEVGDTIEDLSFLQPTGDEVRLSELYLNPRKRLLLVTTSAEWCTACIKEQPKLQELYERYQARGLGVVVTLFQDNNFEPATPALAAEWRERYELSFKVWADPKSPSTFSPYYDVNLTPMVMLIELDSMSVRYLTQGFDEEGVVRQIEATLGAP